MLKQIINVVRCLCFATQLTKRQERLHKFLGISIQKMLFLEYRSHHPAYGWPLPRANTQNASPWIAAKRQQIMINTLLLSNYRWWFIYRNEPLNWLCSINEQQQQQHNNHLDVARGPRPPARQSSPCWQMTSCPVCLTGVNFRIRDNRTDRCACLGGNDAAMYTRAQFDSTGRWWRCLMRSDAQCVDKSSRKTMWTDAELECEIIYEVTALRWRRF